jgi:hypothetical protein
MPLSWWPICAPSTTQRRAALSSPHHIQPPTSKHTLTVFCKSLVRLQDATELVAKLRAFHHAAQSSADKRSLGQCGLDLINGEVVNNVEAGVLEPALSKTKMIQVGAAIKDRC